MLHFLPSPVLFVINAILLVVNVIVVATPIMLLGIIRMVLPFDFSIRIIDRINFYLYRFWTLNIRIMIALTNDVKWHMTGITVPHCHKSCIIISNHVSWFDILLICVIYGSKLPTTKFFMKQSLIYIPFIGLACYALGMPFLKRYSKDILLKNPALRMKDIETTKKVCKALVKYPTTLINFCEGSRYTKEKAEKQKSPYQFLLPPKAASIGVALFEIGNDVEYIFNSTLYYPENSKSAFMDMMFGKLSHIYVDVDLLKKDETLIGDYLGDKQFKHDFTMHIREIWENKDAILSKMHADFEKNSGN